MSAGGASIGPFGTHRDWHDYEAHLPLKFEGIYNRLRYIGAGTEGSGSMREPFDKPRHRRNGSIK